MTTTARCLDPSAVPDAVLLPSPAWSYVEEAEGDVPYPWEVSLAYPYAQHSYLDHFLHDGVLMADQGGATENSDQVEYPPLVPGGGPANKYPHPTWMKVMMTCPPSERSGSFVILMPRIGQGIRIRC